MTDIKTKTYPFGDKAGCSLYKTEASADETQINHPRHYLTHPSGVECIAITEHHDFCVGNAIKYLWRAGLKMDEHETPGKAELRDLKKARWYLSRKIERIEKMRKEGGGL